MGVTAPAVDALRVETVDSLESIEAEWRTLGERSDNVFATWEWLATWWRHFGRDRPLHLSVGRRADGHAAAILPLYCAARRPVRVVRLLGHGPSDQLGPICAPADRAAAALALRDRLHDPSFQWDLAIADELPGDTQWSALLGARLLARSSSPVVRIGGTSWQEFFAARGDKLRYQLRNDERRLTRMGTVTYRYTTDPEQLDADLSTFFALHAARWEHAPGGSRAFVGREPFHREFAALALARGWLRLWFLELDGRPVAGLYNLRLGTSESTCQAGRIPDGPSVGTLLNAHALREAFDDGLAEYRFLRGAEAYKLRFADHDSGLEAVGFTRGPAARAVLRGLGNVPALPRWRRRRIPAAFAWGTGSAPRWGKP